MRGASLLWRIYGVKKSQNGTKNHMKRIEISHLFRMLWPHFQPNRFDPISNRAESSNMVPMAGVEPAQLPPLPPQDSVSTNSTTSAIPDLLGRRQIRFRRGLLRRLGRWHIATFEHRALLRRCLVDFLRGYAFGYAIG